VPPSPPIPRSPATLADLAGSPEAAPTAPAALLAAPRHALRRRGRDDWERRARAALDAAAAAGDRVAERLAGAALVAGPCAT
jgi:hypothetical protein